MSVPQRDDQGGPWSPPPPPPQPPVFNNMPPAVILIAGSIIAASLVGQVQPAFAQWLYNAGVFIAAEPGAQLPRQPLGPVAPLFLHVFLHAGVLHIAMNMAILVAAGRAFGLRLGSGWLGSAGFVFFFFACAASGAAAETFTHQGPPTAMVGASTGVSGLIAAAGWVRGGWRGMASLALPWIGINLLIGLLGGAFPIPIGWVAHIGGTLAGIVLAPLVIAVFSDEGV